MVSGEVNLEIREVKGSTQLIYVKKKCYLRGVGTVHIVELNLVIGLVRIQLNLWIQGRENPSFPLGLSLARV